MKTKLSNIAIAIAALTFSICISADEIALPKITKPSQLQEGVQRTLTDSQISDLLPWVKNSKLSLLELLEDVREMSINDKINHLTNGITAVVSESTPTSELLMRYVLNRALVLQETLLL